MSTCKCIVPDSPPLGMFENVHNKTEKIKPVVYNKMIGGSTGRRGKSSGGRGPGGDPGSELPFDRQKVGKRENCLPKKQLLLR